jgi:hypothetical protein
MGLPGLPSCVYYLQFLLIIIPSHSTSLRPMPGILFSQRPDLPNGDDRGNACSFSNGTASNNNGAKQEKCWSCKIETARREMLSADGLSLRRICRKCARGLTTQPLHSKSKR